MPENAPPRPPPALFIQDWGPTPPEPSREETGQVTTMQVGEETGDGGELQR
ncbi:hypothetical protein MYMAC_000281 [Corallococcus macrosporus DSM 14697]|uniref:Uncharacterized protein n=1 Tax=Corallococcus macrosporus DSM 14697 TaxID=1189310 RepID=A0A250JM42_9BACT|nr:hypothetical protein MYMAC_000281 [Corallococcus macrosporus DSM 14697]